MKIVYDHYALGLRLSHLALLWNLGRFAYLSAEPPPAKSFGELADFVTLYSTFLVLRQCPSARPHPRRALLKTASWCWAAAASAEASRSAG